MEKDSRDTGFEDFLRQQTERHFVSPSERVWMSIHQRMHPKSRWPMLAAAAVLFGLGVMTGLLLDAERSQTLNPSITASPVRISEDKWTDPTPSTLESNRIGNSGSLSKTGRLAYLQGSSQTEAKVGKQDSRTETEPLPPNGRGPAHPTQTGGYSESNRPTSSAEELSTRSDFLRMPAIGSLGLSSLEIEEAPHRPILNIDNEGKTSVEIAKPNAPDLRRRRAVQLYFSPSVSYRRLVGQATDYNYVYSGLPYSANLGFPSDVNKAVTHKPSIGMELGAAVAYPVTSNLRFKAGLQFNMNNYDIEAYNYTAEMAPLTAAVSPGYSRPINTVSYYRNFFGFSRTWLRNTHFMVSTPIGLELSIPAGRKVNVNLASTIQPTYTIGNNSYLISTNLKNYAQEPSLYRKWNVNAGAEAYLSVSKGSYRWIVGPQIRYQLLSSYKENYPISEHLIDYGMKFGIQKTIR